LEDSSKLERRIKMIAKFKKTSRKRSVAAVLVLAALACITLTDAYSAPPFIFGTPTNLGPMVNSAYADNGTSLSADGLELYFGSDRPGGSGGQDIWVTTRETKDDDWGQPVNLGPPVNSSDWDWMPSISADGLTLYFGSMRPGGSGNYDLWVTTRETTNANWGTPVNLGPPVNSSADEIGPSISADGLSLYFSEYEVFRPGGYGLTDMWVTTRRTVSDPWGTPMNLGSTVNSSSWDDVPSISADGLLLFFRRWPGGYGADDIWVTTRATKDDAWEAPVNLGPLVNSWSREVSPDISADGSTLYFSSDRPGGFGSWDLWQVRVRPMRVIADFNWDGKVDFKDFSKLAQYLGQYEPWVDIAPAPPPGDGIVDYKDVGVFSESWLLSTRQASNPNPADGATGVDIEADLSWKPGDGAALHEVYFGSDPCALPLVSTQPAGQESYDPGDPNLILSTTYYWRIDEVNDAGPHPGKWPGVLWSFSTVRGQAHTPSPADDAVIPGVDIEYPPGSGNWYIYTRLIFGEGPTADPDPNVRRAYFSNNRDDVVNRVQDANLGPPPSATRYYVGLPMFPPANDTLVRGTRYYWCVDETDADGHTYPGDIWEFTIQGYYAFAPNPPNDAILVDPNVVLSWGEGYGVQEHDIYFGTSWDDVNNADASDTTGIYRGFRRDPNYPCSNLELTTKFYWRVDEVQGRVPPLFPGIIYKGDVWSFTTGDPTPP
jgi:hypothetical protein